MKKVKIYTNGAIVKLHNRRIVFVERADGGYKIEFNSHDKDAHIPAVLHKCDKGLIRRSLMNISEEGLDALFEAYQSYKQQKK